MIEDSSAKYFFTNDEQEDASCRSADRAATIDYMPFGGLTASDSNSRTPLTVAVIGPDCARREAVLSSVRGNMAADVRDVLNYPTDFGKVATLRELRHDVIIVDLDADTEVAVQLVERFNIQSTAMVMVYSEDASSDKLMRSMRAGAREFLTIPVIREALDQALSKAIARRAPVSSPKESGQLLTFMGAKGGVGVTTLACNFALALAGQRGQRVLLIDLAIPLGDVALNLGIQGEFSIVNALQAADRLDSAFLAKLLVKHSSGLSVLPAPGKFVSCQLSDEALVRLLAVSRLSFDHVVVDAGSRLDIIDTSLFKEATAIYLVVQVGVAELRNASRLISELELPRARS